MTSKRGLLFAAAVVLQVLLLLGMGARHTYTLQTGRAVRLETAPVDPWEIFRGQYVALNYKISQIQGGEVPMIGAPYQRGQRIWVTLREGDPYWVATGVADQRPDTAANEVAMQATVQYWMDSGIEGRPQVNLRYGIEQFFVPEGEGPPLEQQRLRISVEAAVDRFGRAAIKRVFVDDKEIQWR
ncbi:MAG TPA: GDYXXLXY domain-containing protein [Symbiobacteriaceae bacterium]|nr:GDYXXLXY domain-containing protein [Symbiobacteriaceae bacterium]